MASVAHLSTIPMPDTLPGKWGSAEERAALRHALVRNNARVLLAIARNMPRPLYTDEDTYETLPVLDRSRFLSLSAQAAVMTDASLTELAQGAATLSTREHILASYQGDISNENLPWFEEVIEIACTFFADQFGTELQKLYDAIQETR